MRPMPVSTFRWTLTLTPAATAASERALAYWVEKQAVMMSWSARTAAWGRVGVAQDQDGQRNAVAAQVFGLRKAAHRKGGGAFLLQHPGHRDIAVAVGIRLDDGRTPAR